MASITIRRLDDQLKARLKTLAAEHGRSMEEEARTLLRDAIEQNQPQSLVDIARELFGPENGVELEPHPPVKPREPPDFGSA